MDLQSLNQVSGKTRVYDPQDKLAQRKDTLEQQGTQTQSTAGPLDRSVEASALLKLTQTRTAQLTVEENLSGAHNAATQVRSLLVEIEVTVTQSYEAEDAQDDLTGPQSKINNMLQAIQQLADGTDLPEELGIQPFGLEALGLQDGLLLGDDRATLEEQLGGAKDSAEASFQQILDALDDIFDHMDSILEETIGALNLGEAGIDPNMTSETAVSVSVQISTELTRLNTGITSEESQALNAFLA